MRLLITITFILTLIPTLSNLNAQTTYEAEDADVIYNGTIETDHTGYSGTGYVNGDNDSYNYTEWAVMMVSAGEQTIKIYYANGGTDDRGMELSINGDTVQSVSFPGSGDWALYDSTTVTATFVEGLNQVRLSASSATNGGPNLDKISITGEQTAAQYKTLNIDSHGDGSFSVSPEQDYYAVGSEVTLIATPGNTTYFGGWIGDLNNSNDTVTYTVDTSNYITAVFMPYNVFVKTNENIGWSTYSDHISGGKGGDTTYVSTQSEFALAVSGDDAKIVLVDTTINFSPVGTEISIGSNTTLAGVEDKAILTGCELRIASVTNVIFQDLTIKDAYVSWDGKETDYDAIEINNSQYVWITHCDLSHYDDGLCDIKNASDFITISWCRFHNHNKTMLIGAGDDATQDENHLNVTVHHNWFDGRYDNGLWRRLPLCRYGKIHVFNNYYCEIANSCVEGNYSSHVVIDNNYFYKSEIPHALVSGVGGAGDNRMSASGNKYVQSGDRRDTGGNVFDPSDYYDFEYNDAEDVPAIVMLGAGVNKDTLIGMEGEVNSADEIVNNTTSGLTIEAYPNPASERLNILISSEDGNIANINLIDITGKIVQSINSYNLSSGKNSIQLRTGNLPSGTYILKVNTNETIKSKKIFIK